MAEEIPENTPTFEEGKTHVQEDMDVEAASVDEPIAPESTGGHPDGAEKPSDNGGVKRGREEEEKDGECGGAAKRPNIERSVEEERLEELEGEEVGGEDGEEKEVQETAHVEDDKKEETEPAAGNVGPKNFCSSVEMFDYFYKLIHDWPTNLDVNKYEHMVLLELLKKGHTDAGKKIGAGIQAFQVRFHPTFKSKCLFIVRVDGSVDDFSFRKCIDNILPLPDNMKLTSESNGKKAWGPHKGGGGSGGGRGAGGGRGGRGGRGHGNRRR